MSNTLHLIVNYFKTEEVRYLNELLLSPPIPELYLNNANGFNGKKIRLLGDVLKVIKIDKLSVAKEFLGSQNVKDLVIALQNTQVHSLDVSFNTIDAQGAKELGVALQYTQVSALNVSFNNIGAQGAKELGIALQNTQVHTLDISFSTIGAQGAKDLGIALQNTQVHTLKVRGNNIGDQGAKDLGLALQETQVHTLDVSGNNINEQGVKDLANALKGSNATRVIGIEHPELTKVLIDNLTRKKNRVIALAQGINSTILPERIGLTILSFSHEAYVSGQADNNTLTFKEGGSRGHTLFGKVLEQLRNKKEDTSILSPSPSN